MLEHDIILNFRSVSMADGHSGTEVKYIADERKVLKSTYCTRERKKLFRKKLETTTNEEQLLIPAYIKNVEELKDYVKKQRCSWLM